MKGDIHDKIIFCAKIAMFIAFGYNLLTVLVKTWKYGGSTSKISVDYDDDDTISIPDDDEEEN